MENEHGQVPVLPSYAHRTSELPGRHRQKVTPLSQLPHIDLWTNHVGSDGNKADEAICLRRGCASWRKRVDKKSIDVEIESLMVDYNGKGICLILEIV